jgi:predicted RNase H-like HicB family nuclease
MLPEPLTPHRYHINVFWYPDDLCWVADVPDLRPCSAHGETPELAMAAVSHAIHGWLETARGADLPIPDPCYSPAIYASR